MSASKKSLTKKCLNRNGIGCKRDLPLSMFKHRKGLCVNCDNCLRRSRTAIISNILSTVNQNPSNFNIPNPNIPNFNVPNANVPNANVPNTNLDSATILQIDAVINKMIKLKNDKIELDKNVNNLLDVINNNFKNIV